MRTTFRRALAAALALLLALTAVPAALIADNEAPAGYNAHDYEKCVAFLETEDAEGVKNGDKLSENYDPADPATWGTYWYEDWDGVHEERDRFRWTEADGELRLFEVCAAFVDMTGPADFADCCALTALWCSSPGVTGVDLSGCTALERFSCQGGRITELDVSDCPALRSLFIDHTLLAELDLTHNPVLSCLSCYSVPLRRVDLSGNQVLETERVEAVGGGTVGCYLHTWDWYDFGTRLTPAPEFVEAQPDEGYRFVGWYEQNGILFSEQCFLEGSSFYGGDMGPVYIAKFLRESTVPGSGDVDADGEMAITDAVLALRASMGLVTLDYDGIVSADVDESGDVTVADALLIARTAMGVIG